MELVELGSVAADTKSTVLSGAQDSPGVFKKTEI